MTTPEAPAANNILDVRDLCVTSGTTTVVSSCSLAVPRGALVALLGGNGSGKSWLLAALAGVAKVQSGVVQLDGFPVTGASPHDLLRRGLVLAPGVRAMAAGLRVEEQLRLGAFWRGRDPEIGDDLERVFTIFPLLRARRRDTDTALDGEGRQELAVARALMARPRLLLLDEPSLGLPPAWRRQFMATLTALRRSGLSLLVADAEAHSLLRIAQHAYLMEGGRTVLAGPAAEVAVNPRLRATAFDGKGQ